MHVLAYIARIEVTTFLGALGLVLTFKILTGQVVLDGLLRDNATGAVSPARIQMLIGSLAATAWAWQSLGGGADQSSANHELLPTLVVPAAAGSQIFYLASKARDAGKPRSS